MMRKAAIGGQLFTIQSLTPNDHSGLDIVYWQGEVDCSALEQITVNGFITLRSGNLEIIKVMDQNLFTI